MTTTQQLPNTFTDSASSQHPLEPLTAEEVATAVAIVRANHNFSEKIRFPMVVLNEPAKPVVLKFKEGDEIEREAFVNLLNNADGTTYEVVVSLTAGTVKSWNHLPDVQPSIMLDEFGECEAAVKASAEFQEAIKKRGITNVDLVMVDAWSAGNYNIQDEKGWRLSRARCWVRYSPTDNGYAKPIEGVIRCS